MEILTIAFSTFLGAAVALAAERLTRLHDVKVAEEASLNSLILDLAAKRCFTVAENWTWVDGEMERVVGSIHHARALIRDARVPCRPRSPALFHLRNMTRACNTFLESSEREDGERLKEALKALTIKTSEEVQAIHNLRPARISGDLPGSFSLDSPTTQILQSPVRE